MNILFVHQNFSGQFKFLAPALAAAGHKVRALAMQGQGADGVEVILYKADRGTSPNVHPWASEVETKIIRGDACARAADQLRAQGYRPDVIVGHPGWGEMLFLRDVWPDVPQLHFLEFYYAVNGSDINFDPEFAKTDWRASARVRAKNAGGLLSLEQMDAGYSPTQWQRSSYPGLFQDRIRVIHDGIDTNYVQPNADVVLRTEQSQWALKPGMEIVTFVNRNLEPYRGYHSFMRALPLMQKLRPNALFILVGGNGVSYGAKAPEGQSWKQIFLDEVQDRIDPSRLVFVGNVNYQVFTALMQISAAHVYLTYPFVLSWSMLEAMSCGAPLIGSRTPPVEEVIDHGRNGLLVDFFDYDALAHTVADVLARPAAFADMRAAGRQTVIDRYDLNRICLPAQMDLVGKVAG